MDWTYRNNKLTAWLMLLPMKGLLC